MAYIKSNTSRIAKNIREIGEGIDKNIATSSLLGALNLI